MKYDYTNIFICHYSTLAHFFNFEVVIDDIRSLNSPPDLLHHIHRQHNTTQHNTTQHNSVLHEQLSHSLSGIKENHVIIFIILHVAAAAAAAFCRGAERSGLLLYISVIFTFLSTNWQQQRLLTADETQPTLRDNCQNSHTDINKTIISDPPTFLKFKIIKLFFKQKRDFFLYLFKSSVDV